MASVLFPNGRKQYVLRRKSTDSLLLPKFRPYPTETDDSPIQDLDADLEFLAVDKDFLPDYDPRLVVLKTDEAKDGNLWHITYEFIKKDTTQIKFAILNAEAVEVNKQLANENQTKLIILGMGAIFRAIEKMVLSDLDQAIKNRVLKASAALEQNDATVAQLNAVADAGGTPDLDNTWAAKT